MTKNDTKYLHASARVHSLENKLISLSQLIKAAGAVDAEAALKLLNDNEIFKDFGLKNYEKAFEADLEGTYRLIEGITDNSQITYIFRYPTDGHNLKVYVKAQMTKNAFEELYKKTGTFTIDKMRQELSDRHFEAIPAGLGEAALAAMERLARTRDSQIVDIIIDKAVLLEMKKKAEEIGNILLCRYVALKIDIINIETAMRLTRMKKKAYQVRNMFAEGGKIEPLDIEAGYGAGYEGIARLIDRAGLLRRMDSSVVALKQGEHLRAFERNIDGCFKELFSETKAIAFGLEPVIAFIYFKEREIRAARLVLASKLFGVAGEQIAERLRYIYAD